MSTGNFPSIGDWQVSLKKLKFQIHPGRLCFWANNFQSNYQSIYLFFYRQEITSNCCENFCGSFSCAPDWKNIEENKRINVKKKKERAGADKRGHISSWIVLFHCHCLCCFHLFTSFALIWFHPRNKFRPATRQVLCTFIQHYYLFLNCVPHTYIYCCLSKLHIYLWFLQEFEHCNHCTTLSR